MKRLLLLFTLLLLEAGASLGWAHPHILQVETGEEIPFYRLIQNLARQRVIFLGETHNHPGHHQMQLAIIRALQQKGLKLAIGLEMIRQGHQEELDQWVAGDLPEKHFLPVFLEDWQWWPVYRDIFHYARQEGIPMVALNVPRQITSQVAAHGFESLSPEQMKQLGNITCVVDPAYERFIRRALGSHAHGSASFRNFCEAQLIWDTAMANRAGEFLRKNPDTTLVVLAGSGHAWKYGIPSQPGLAEESYQVVLPEAAGRATPATVTAEDADFLWLDQGPDGWQAGAAGLPADPRLARRP